MRIFMIGKIGWEEDSVFVAAKDSDAAQSDPRCPHPAHVDYCEDVTDRLIALHDEMQVARFKKAVTEPIPLDAGAMDAVKERMQKLHGNGWTVHRNIRITNVSGNLAEGFLSFGYESAKKRDDMQTAEVGYGVRKYVDNDGNVFDIETGDQSYVADFLSAISDQIETAINLKDCNLSQVADCIAKRLDAFRAEQSETQEAMSVPDIHAAYARDDRLRFTRTAEDEQTA